MMHIPMIQFISKVEKFQTTLSFSFSGSEWMELQSAFHSERNILTSLPHTCNDSWKLHSGGRLLNFHEAYLSASRMHISYQLIQGTCFFLPTRSWHYKCQRLICYVKGKWNEQGPCGLIRTFNRKLIQYTGRKVRVYCCFLRDWIKLLLVFSLKEWRKHL